MAEKILVVDDAPQNVKLLRLILKDAGYDVVEGYSGAEALEKLRSENPAALILDVRMPGMTGYEVARIVRADPGFATLPIIMVTALSMPEERIKGIESGATDFITKPFDKKELLARLQSSLALVKAEARGVLGQLEGMVMLTDPAWRMMALSPLAAEALGVPPDRLAQADLYSVLTEREVQLPDGDDEIFDFRLRGADGRELSGRSTPVTDARNNLLYRITVLREESGSGIG